MKSVAENLTKWRRYYAAKCTKHKGGFDNMPTNCYCETAAQVQAHIECVLPEGYTHYEIDDFTGMKDNKRVISPKVVKEARQAIISYCWQNIQEGEEYDIINWWPRSAIARRRANGNSLVIYGNPWSNDIVGGSVKTFKKPLGRTLIAAIVMKEAIRQRANAGHMADSYAWVSYNRLYDKLMSRAKDNHDFNEELASYEFADWLVVDGMEIEKQNEATRMFKAKVLDSFFDERMRAGLPNILVFQDDLSNEAYDLRAEFGLSVNNIINSPKTTRVKLLDGK